MIAVQSVSLAAAPADVPGAPEDYAFEQKLGAAVPKTGLFTTDEGQEVRMGDLLGHRPLILALGYFHCPSLCSVVRDDLLTALDRSGLVAGRDYDLLVVSIDPNETPDDARRAKSDDMERSAAPGSTAWLYLTARDGADLAALEDAVGFKSRYDVQLKQFLHPAGIVALTADGLVSRYVLGVGYRAGDVRAAIATASTGGIAKAALPILLLCFHYDEATGRYSLAIMKVLRLAGALTIVVMGTVLIMAFRRNRRA